MYRPDVTLPASAVADGEGEKSRHRPPAAPQRPLRVGPLQTVPNHTQHPPESRCPKAGQTLPRCGSPRLRRALMRVTIQLNTAE